MNQKTLFLTCRFFLGTVLFTAIGVRSTPLKATETEEKMEPQCAQYCIHFCCQLLGVPLTLDRVCEMLPPKAEGESFTEIAKTLENVGFKVKGLEITYDELEKGPFPLMAHVKMGSAQHFVIVEAADKNNVMLLDGHARRRIWQAENFRQRWTGYVITIAKPPRDVLLPIYRSSTKLVPRLQFNTLFSDCGEVSLEETETVNFDFPFENRGTADLRVLKVKSTCRCAVAHYPKHAIPPGGKGTISIKVDLTDLIGSFGKIVYVVSNDPVFPVIELRVAGNASQELQVSSKYIDLGKVVASECVATNFFIKYWGDTLLELSDFKTDLTGLEMRFEPVTDATLRHLYNGKVPLNIKMIELNNFFVVKLCYKAPQSSPQNIEGKICISTNLPRKLLLEIPVIVEVVSPIAVRPDVLFLGEIAEGSFIRETIIIKSRTGSPLVVHAVDLENTNLKCVYSLDNSGNITLTFTGKIVNQDQVDKKVTIHLTELESKKSFTVELPIFGLFRKN